MCFNSILFVSLQLFIAGRNKKRKDNIIDLKKVKLFASFIQLGYESILRFMILP